MQKWQNLTIFVFLFSMWFCHFYQIFCIASNIRYGRQILSFLHSLDYKVFWQILRLQKMTNFDRFWDSKNLHCSPGILEFSLMYVFLCLGLCFRRAMCPSWAGEQNIHFSSLTIIPEAMIKIAACSISSKPRNSTLKGSTVVLPRPNYDFFFFWYT
jgi:hypothetical protein